MFLDNTLLKEYRSLIIKRVATSILTYRGRILLLQRSSRVGSYPGVWAGVSGYIERDEEPLETALKEVREETGLSLGKEALVARGEPLPAYDREKDVLWLVYTFLFKAPTDRIRLDWEHQNHTWVRPNEIRRYSTVPRLSDALERVKPQAQRISKRLRIYLKEMEGDVVHGSSLLASRAAEMLCAASDSFRGVDVEDYLSFLKRYARMLAKTRPSMLTIENALIYLLGRVMEGYEKGLGVDDLKALLRGALKRWLASKEDAFKNCVEYASMLLKDGYRAITHSYSSTVLEAFKKAAAEGKHIEVYVSESRPRFEGRMLAKRLAESGCKATLITDAALGHYTKDADLALVGADCILADGSVVNKVGTYLLALASSRAGIPFYAAAETLKIGVRSLFSQPVLEERAVGEALRGLRGVKAKNLYFDVTPADLVTSIVCEYGAIRVNRVYELAEAAFRSSYFP